MSEPCPYCGGRGGMHFWAGDGGCPATKENKDNLKSLLTRAADALEGKYQNENVGLNHEDVIREFKSFIAELRKAAE